MPGLRRGRSHPGKEGTPLKIKNGFPRRQTERNGAYRDQVRPPFPTARELNLASCKFVRVGLQMLLLPVRGRRFCHVSHGYRTITGWSCPARGRSLPREWFSIERIFLTHHTPPGDKIKSASARHRVMRSFSSLFQKSLPFCSFSKKSSRQRAMVSLPGHPPRVSYFFRLHQRVGPSCSSTNRQRRRTFCEGRFLRSVSAKTLSTSSR